jgi:hypothetical protein
VTSQTFNCVADHFDWSRFLKNIYSFSTFFRTVLNTFFFYSTLLVCISLLGKSNWRSTLIFQLHMISCSQIVSLTYSDLCFTNNTWQTLCYLMLTGARQRERRERVYCIGCNSCEPFNTFEIYVAGHHDRPLNSCYFEAWISCIECHMM